ncbi:hypothetical protein, partial [Kordia sp.]|uniref:hypothetical protein n=1 Tax=Kordia sp. TaxID=1965332 RepID=UPI003D269770
PWRKFRKIIAILAFSAKNTSGKVPFLLFLFFGQAKKKKIKSYKFLKNLTILLVTNTINS